MVQNPLFQIRYDSLFNSKKWPSNSSKGSVTPSFWPSYSLKLLYVRPNYTFYLRPSRSIRWSCSSSDNECTFWSAVEILISFDVHGHLDIWTFGHHGDLDIMEIWTSWTFGHIGHLNILDIWTSRAFEHHGHLDI